MTPIVRTWPAVRRPTPNACSAPSRSWHGRRSPRSRSSASDRSRSWSATRSTCATSARRTKWRRDPRGLGQPLGRDADRAAIARLVDLFHEKHRHLYGHASPESDVELMTLTVAAIGPDGREAMPEIARRHGRRRSCLQRDPAGLLRGVRRLRRLPHLRTFATHGEQSDRRPGDRGADGHHHRAASGRDGRGRRYGTLIVDVAAETGAASATVAAPPPDRCRSGHRTVAGDPGAVAAMRSPLASCAA